MFALLLNWTVEICGNLCRTSVSHGIPLRHKVDQNSMKVRGSARCKCKHDVMMPTNTPPRELVVRAKCSNSQKVCVGALCNSANYVNVNITDIENISEPMFWSNKISTV